MVSQIILGSGLMCVTILAVGVGFWLLEEWMTRARPWLLQHPHRPRLMLALGVLAVWILAEITFAVWLWALVFRALGLFAGLEPAVYFALTVFTTLGFGDVLLPQDWRLLSGLAATNGLLLFGLITAVVVESLRQIRLGQLAAEEKA